MSLVAVADAGPIIHLAEIESLALLAEVDQLYLPEVVYDELEVGGLPDGLDSIEYELVTTTMTCIEDEELDPGEASALAVSKERDAVLLTDDLAAREVAAQTGVEVHGSIGVIALGHSRGRLDRDEAASLMRTLQRETSLFVTDAVVRRGIELLDERGRTT
ncbi:nucleic acid-binding protein [Halorussus amylolyticus]|uniref:nucleic acid-binding protein n=1 Tax=Halorussus amylolyticus TaxID=1126242 RepID=UPI00138F4711|nr:nucleic acid-binding protein [Halorussus amylolyticus]